MARHSIKVHYLLTNHNPSSGLPAVEYSWSTSLSGTQPNPGWGLLHAKELFIMAKSPHLQAQCQGQKFLLSSQTHYRGKIERRQRNNVLKTKTAVWYRYGLLGIKCDSKEFRNRFPRSCYSVLMYIRTYNYIYRQTCKLQISHSPIKRGCVCGCTCTVVIRRKESYIASPKGV